MPQIILVDSDKQLTTPLKAKLVKNPDIEVIVKETASEALSIFQILGEVKLIIAKDQNGKEATAAKIYEQIRANPEEYPQDVPLLILGKNNTASEKIKSVPYSTGLDYIVGLALFLMGLGPEPQLATVPKVGVPKTTGASASPSPQPEPVKAPAPPVVTEKSVEYVAVNIHVFLYFAGMQNLFETFTRTRRKDKGHDYSTKIPKDAVIEDEGLNRLITRGVEELYVRKEDFLSNQLRLNTILEEKLLDNTMAGIDKLELCSTLFKLGLDLIKYEVHTNETARLFKKTALAIRGLIVQSNNVFMLFENGRKIKELSYGFCHSFLTNTLLYKCLSGMEWYNSELEEKIFTAIFLHDLALQSDKMIRAHHHFFSEQRAFSPEDSSLVQAHALIGSEVFLKLGLATSDMVPLLKEHHGIKSGKGFAETLSIIISPLSMCLLTIEEFVTRYLDLAPDFSAEDLQGIFTEMEKKYNKLTYDLTLKKLRAIYK